VAAGNRAGRNRNANLDRLRILAILDVVAIHIYFVDNPGHLLFGMGLPVFLVLTCGLGLRRADPPPLGEFVAKRWQRLLLPWAAWSVIHALFFVVRANLGEHTEPSFAWFEPQMVLYGSRIELWFLPFAFAAGIAAYGMHRLTSSWRDVAVIVLGFVSGFAIIALITLSPWGTLDEPFAQWCFGLPAVPFGWAMGRVLRINTETHSPSRRGLVIWAGAGFLVAVAGLIFAYDTMYTASRFLLAIALILGALAWPGKPDRLTAAILPTVFGIYLLHGMIIDIAKHQLATLHRVPAALAVFIISVVVVLVLRKTPLRAVT